jgi:endoglucanase
MALDLSTHLKALCAAPGLSGYEHPIRQVVEAAWQPYVDAFGSDRVGSLWGFQHGTAAHPRPRILFAAHMDAIGLMVSRVEGDFLRVTHVGGIDARVLPGQIVMVHGRADLPAVVGRPAHHLLPRAHRDSVAPIGELVVDTGLPAERLRALVRPGDLVSFAHPPRDLLNKQLAAKSLDNRASVATLSLALEHLRHRPHAWDVVMVATVQEEEVLLGATTSAFDLAPDLAVAVDVTFGKDSNTTEHSTRTFELGDGPVLGLGPNIHPSLHAAFKTAAERADIPFNTEAMASGSGTDAYAMQVARAGIPAMVIGLPLRNMHTPVEIIALKDIHRAARLLAEFAANLAPDFMSTIKFDD